MFDSREGKQMRLTALAVLMLVATALWANTPEEGFEAVVNAVYQADAEAFLEALSMENQQQLEAMVMMVKMSPGEAAAQISSELGEEITPEELAAWTAVDMVGVFLSASTLREQLPDRDDLVVVRSEIAGDSAMVYLQVPEVEEELSLLMVLQGDEWKLGESFMGIGG